MKFTPTEDRMLAVLSDGGSHTLEELRACLNDELQDANAVHVHLTYIRRKLKDRGQTISCERNGNGTSRFRHTKIPLPFNIE